MTRSHLATHGQAPNAARQPGRSGQRGSALVAVLMVLVFLEVALIAAAMHVLRVSWGFHVVAGRDAADRLAAAGLAHAEAHLAVEPLFRGVRFGGLAEGEYLFEVEDGPLDGVRIVCIGRTWNRRAVRLDAEYLRAGPRYAQVKIERSYRHVRGPLRPPGS